MKWTLVDLSKPPKGSGRLERRKRKAVKQRPRKRAERLQAKIDAEIDRAIRFACFERDHGRCRAFGTSLVFEGDYGGRPPTAENHHIILRSAGGSDEPENRLTLSPYAHFMRHKLGTLDIDGKADGLVTFTLYRWVNGQRVFVRQWKG